MVQLTDGYNRKMDYLRISVTDRCNFRCQYCMPENIEFKDKSHILTLEEMLTFAEACLQLGVTKVRVTGGEPLVRRGVVKFVGWLKDLGFEDVTRSAGVEQPRWGTSCCFVDYDRDGWLDLVVVKYLDYDPSHRCNGTGGRQDFCHPKVFPPTVARLFRNAGILPASK